VPLRGKTWSASVRRTPKMSHDPKENIMQTTTQQEAMDTPAMDQYAVRLASMNLSAGSVFVAVAYDGCRETWALCSGSNREQVEKAADLYIEMFPGESPHDPGPTIQGDADGYWIMEAPLLLPNQDLSAYVAALEEVCDSDQLKRAQSALLNVQAK